MSPECLKGVIRVLDQGLSPLEHVRSNAIEARSEEPDAFL